MRPNWQLFKFPSLADMNQAREQCHQAIQNVAAVGRSFSVASKEDEFANLNWDFGLQRLVGHWVKGNITFRSSICIKDFEVYLVNENIKTISSISMQDITQTDVMVWLEHELSKLGVDFSKINLTYPYEIPEYPTAKREAFHLDNLEACDELSRLYNNTSLVLTELFKKEKNVSSIKCWPHHFDIAARVTMLDTGDPETSRSINLGMSPGDKYYNEPYFYVSPIPYPTENLLDLSKYHGHWHQNDWVGAVLPYSRLSGLELIQDQKSAIKKFISTAYSFLKETM